MENLIKKFRVLNRKWIATLAGFHFYGNASQKMKVVGVTGTNGKTTIATLLYKLFTGLGYKVGLISTVENIIVDEVREATHTTPGPIPLNKLLNEMVKKGCQYVFMEVSSHAVDQKRIAGINFAGGVFTNLTQDHLDYHKSMDNYFRAKKKFFKIIPKGSFALSNTDDSFGNKMLEGIKAKKYAYGFKSKADFNEHLQSKLIGEFNAYNILAIYATAVLLGQDKDKVKEILKNLESVAGRFQSIKSENGVTGIVDFAHTPDALENVLKTINKMKDQIQKVITVVGCGGDRDKTKRPIMAKISYDMSDILIMTSDNPRNEKPEDILRDMEEGLKGLDKNRYFIIADRRDAIKKACEVANKGDYVLLAGKGHENYQVVGNEKLHFNDTEELKKYLK